MIPGKPHIHYTRDGRPPRYVYLNGRRVEKAIFADTKRGIVRCYVDGDTPLRFHLMRRNQQPPVQTLSGKVRVETIPRGE